MVEVRLRVWEKNPQNIWIETNKSSSRLCDIYIEPDVNSSQPAQANISRNSMWLMNVTSQVLVSTVFSTDEIHYVGERRPRGSSPLSHFSEQSCWENSINSSQFGGVLWEGTGIAPIREVLLVIEANICYNWNGIIDAQYFEG